ncbi:major capsid protein [Chitinasiproducens palmae]|uniref:Major capsid protein n=1 Tax=Chitinasiproducens palmae TaxID=1770053 RepID=A0A1H2PSQ3_9BURK|nr:hypothetical protein [Chitinasiproducens palmae]SDV49196.1 hypothetical protein SAMN05216551_107144 [Chitinasiproducens palmae]
MAIISKNNLSLIDISKRLDPDGRTADVAELLANTHEIIEDIPWIEGNLPTGNRSTIRTGLPVPIWRKLYQGVPPSKSTTAQVDDTCGMLEARSEPDVDAVRLAVDPNMFRMDEASTFIETMGQTFASTLFYGDTSINPEQFYGLVPRYSTIAGGASAQNIIDAGGTGSNNTSIWVVGWSRRTVYGIYPRNSKAGLQHRDLGEIDAFDANQNRYRAYADLFKWDCGLVVKDWRYVVRIANVDVANLTGTNGNPTTAAANLINLMIMAKRRMPSLNGVMPRVYANRTVLQALDIQALNKSSNALAIRQAADQFATEFLGIPLREVDQILNTEARVV